MSRGKIIVVDGPDGAGKTTVVAEMVRQLLAREGDQRVAVFAFPSHDGAVGRLIRRKLGGEEDVFDDRAFLHMFAADGLSQQPKIDALLAEDVVVICDRHPITSSYLYQVCGMRRFTEIAWRMTTRAPFAELEKEAFFAFLDVPHGVARQRVEKRGDSLSRFDAAGSDFHDRVRRGCSQLHEWLALRAGTASASVLYDFGHALPPHAAASIILKDAGL